MYKELEEQFDKIYYEFMTIVTQDQYKERVIAPQIGGELSICDDPRDKRRISVRVRGNGRSLIRRMEAVRTLYSQIMRQVHSHIIKLAYEGGDLEGLEKSLETDLRGDGIEFVARLVNETEIRVISYWKNQDHDITVVQNFVEDYKQKHPADPLSSIVQPVNPSSFVLRLANPTSPDQAGSLDIQQPHRTSADLHRTDLSSVLHSASPTSPELHQADATSPDHRVHSSSPILTPEKIDLKGRITLNIVEGDLTSMKCDAIVSPSTPDLSNSGGISKAIATHCGLKFQSGCDRYVRVHGVLRTGTIHKQRAEGQLLCNGVKYVLLAIIPDAREPDDDDDGELVNIIYEALSSANTLGCKSVAFPAAICEDFSSSFKEKYFKAFWDATQQFVGTPKPRLRELYFVSDDITTVLQIRETMQTYSSTLLSSEISGSKDTLKLSHPNLTVDLDRSSPTGFASAALDSSVEEENESVVFRGELEKQFDKIYYEFMMIVTEDQYKEKVLDVVREKNGELEVRDDPDDSLKVYVKVIGIKKYLDLMMHGLIDLYMITLREVHSHMLKSSYAGEHMEELGKALERDLRGRSIEFVARFISQPYIHVIGYVKNREHDITVIENFVENFKETHAFGRLDQKVGSPSGRSSSTLRRVKSDRSVQRNSSLHRKPGGVEVERSTPRSEFPYFIPARIGWERSLPGIESPPHTPGGATPHPGDLVGHSTPNTADSSITDRSPTANASSSMQPNTHSTSSPDLSITGRLSSLSLSDAEISRQSLTLGHSGVSSRSPLSKLLSVDCNMQNDLHRAVETGHPTRVTQILQTLLSDGEREEALRVKDGSGCTPLRTAAYYGKVPCVRSILNSVGASWVLKIAECTNASGYTAAHKAATKGNADVLECIISRLQKNERYHLLNMQLQDGMTVLHQAVDRNYVEIIRCLRKHVSENDWLDLLKIKVKATGCNVLHKVVTTKLDNTSHVIGELIGHLNIETKFVLLQQVCSAGNTVIQLAIKHDNYLGVQETLASLLPDKRVVLLLSRDCSDSTVMHLAAIHNNTEFFKDIENGLESGRVLDLLTTKDNQKLTPIFYAVSHNCLEIVEMFLGYFTPEEIYSQLLMKDQDGSTALHLAAEKGGKTMQYLISLGDGRKYISEEINENGDTILHILSANGDMTTIKHCLNAMPDELRSELLRLANHNGKTAYALAPSAKIRELLAWSAEQEGFYYLPTPPVVLVMYSTIDRDGAHEEQETVVSALPPFGLKPIVEPDLTRQEMLDKIKAALTQENISGLIVFIMGHGKQGAVFAKDGEVKIQDIIDTMCDPVLKNKPKVLMVQACRMSDSITVPEETEEAKEASWTSENSKESFSEKSLANPKPSVKPQANPNTAGGQADVGPPASQYSQSQSSASSFEIHEGDVVTVLATVSGGKAMRNTMLPVFAKQLLRFRNKDIHTIFLKTQHAVKALNPGQVLEYRTTLCQELCLDNVFKSV